jgi:hypothetical protein
MDAVVPPRAAQGRDNDFDDFISRSAPPPRHSFNATPIVLGIIAIVVFVGVIWAFNALTAPAPPIGGPQGLDLSDDGDSTRPPSQSTPTASPTASPTTSPTSAPTGTAPVIASGQMLDPPPGGDNNEHPEVAALAVDGDPTTKWYSRMYNDPTFGMKPGIGYAVTLTKPATVTTVTLLVNGTGGNVEVRATDPSTPTHGTVLASGPLSPTTVLELSAPTETETIVLWFTALPQNPDAENRIELFEVQVN